MPAHAAPEVPAAAPPGTTFPVPAPAVAAVLHLLDSAVGLQGLLRQTHGCGGTVRGECQASDHQSGRDQSNSQHFRSPFSQVFSFTRGRSSGATRSAAQPGTPQR